MHSIKCKPTTILNVLSDEFTESQIRLLRQNGIYTVEILVTTSKTRLKELLNCTDNHVTKLLAKGYSVLPARWFMTAEELHQQRQKHITRLTTGSKNLDAILGGGIESNGIVEFFGSSGCGKSQFAMCIAVTCQLSNSNGGLTGKCLYIDTTGDFRTERILQIGKRFGINDKTILQNIMYTRVRTTDQLLAVVEASYQHIRSDWVPLLIVDSVTQLFKLEFPGVTNLDMRQERLGKVVATLKNLAEHLLITVVVTNSCYANFMQSTVVPYGGQIMESICSTRVQMQKNLDGSRSFKIYASSLIPDLSCTSFIKEGGLED